MKLKVKTIWMTAMAFLVLSFGVSANEQPGAAFKKIYKDEGTLMQLHGTGLKSVFFKKAFEAGLYLEDDVPAEHALGNVPKHLEVSYFTKIKGDHLNRFTVKCMKDNTTKEEFRRIEDRLAFMEEYFVDLNPGDRYALTYLPNVGTKFSKNDQLIGIVKGEDFAKALFATWFGAKPFDANLKSQILGKL